MRYLITPNHDVGTVPVVPVVPVSVLVFGNRRWMPSTPTTNSTEMRRRPGIRRG